MAGLEAMPPVVDYRRLCFSR